MSFRFIQAKQIFDGYRFLPHDTVLVIDEKNIIKEITISNFVASDNIEFIDTTICPQFINAHCHIELSHLKNRISQKEGLIPFITNILNHRNAEKEVIEAAANDAVLEMKKNGICAVGDICNTRFSLATKQKNKDIYFHNFIEVSGFDASKAIERFDTLKIVFELFEQNFPRQNSIVAHAPYSVSDNLFDKILQHNSKIQSIHNQETLPETQLFENGTGDFIDFYKTLNIDISSFVFPKKTSLQYWLQKYKQQKIISVHNSFITPQDLAMATSSNHEIYFCLCPNANLYIENVLPPIDKLFDTDIDIVLGTDSLASNHQLDIRKEIETIRKYFPTIGLEKILQAATLNGAKALGIDKELGSFQIGKKGLFVVLN